MNNTNKLLSITNLKKYFPIAKSKVFQREQFYVRANEEITIDIHSGETFGLVGESGCGKSTLGRTILQLYSQTAGSTLYYGRTLEDFAPSYVSETLRNAPKMIAKYQKMLDKAEALEKECEQAGDAATFIQHQNKNLAAAEAHTAFQNVVKILGGFAADTQGLSFPSHHIGVLRTERTARNRSGDLQAQAFGLCPGSQLFAGRRINTDHFHVVSSSV